MVLAVSRLPSFAFLFSCPFFGFAQFSCVVGWFLISLLMIRLCAWPPGVGVLCACSLFLFQWPALV
jgi:hypothetical protein